MEDKFGFSDRIASESGKGTQSVITFKGNIRAELFDKDGNLKELREIHNLVTTAGKNAIMDQILGTPTLVKVGWMELGTGSPAATLLGAYITGSRVALTSKLRANAIITMVGDWPAGTGTGAITEAGLFDVVTQNTVNMWCSTSFAVVNKGADDSFKLTWSLSAT